MEITLLILDGFEGVIKRQMCPREPIYEQDLPVPAHPAGHSGRYEQEMSFQVPPIRESGTTPCEADPLLRKPETLGIGDQSLTNNRTHGAGKHDHVISS